MIRLRRISDLLTAFLIFLLFVYIFVFLWIKQENKIPRHLIQRHLELDNIVNEDTAKCSGVHELSCVEPYFSRIAHLRKECLKQLPSDDTLLSPQLKFSEKLHLTICAIPGVASCSIHRSLFQLDSGYARTNPYIATTCLGKLHKSFEDIEKKKKSKLLVQNYTSFLISRHPFERLVSVYLSKFIKSSDSYFREIYGKPVAMKQANQYLHGIEPRRQLLEMRPRAIKLLPKVRLLPEVEQSSLLKYIEVMKSGKISFPQFVKFLIDYYKDEKVKEMDVHWRPQVLLCQPCAFNYSYIMTSDQIENDSNRLFDYLEQHILRMPLEDDVRIEPNKGFAENASITKKMFENVSEEDIKMLRLIYEDDFAVFDYDPYRYYGF